LIEGFPNLAAKLKPNKTEIGKSSRVVALIREEKGLQTSGVIAGLRKIEGLAKTIKKQLVCLGDTKGKSTRKKSESGSVTAIIDDKITYYPYLTYLDIDGITRLTDTLNSARKSLATQIRVACVGLSKTGGKIMVTVAAVKSTDEAVMKVFGKDCGLHIASYLKKLSRKPDSKPLKKLLFFFHLP